jgi:Amt family ammonium transporter
MNTGDITWVLLSSALVMLMTPALGLFYGGMVRKKNLLSTIMLSFSLLAVISIQWIVYGYSLSFGPDIQGMIGGLKWLGLAGVGAAPNPDYAATIPHAEFMLFQMMFAVITPALISGAFVERIKFSSFLIFTLLWATFVYDPVCHWVWAVGGWIRNLGALDFAGGTVVHITAGFSALMFALVIRQRKGFTAVTMEPNNIPYTIIGAALLWFGWFGFNGGSALGANALAVNAFIVTNTAAAAAGVTWMFINWLHRKPSAIGVATGVVVGLVAITPASGFVTPLSAIAIGAGGAGLSYCCINLRNKLKIDESLDVWACHGMGGLWGAIATGIFASKAVNPAGVDGLIYGNPALVGKQLIAALAVIAYAMALTWIFAKVVDMFYGLSVSDAEEQVGLDISQHGEEAYS